VPCDHQRKQEGEAPAEQTKKQYKPQDDPNFPLFEEIGAADAEKKQAAEEVDGGFVDRLGSLEVQGDGETIEIDSHAHEDEAEEAS
jgi:hypothetical protein